MKKDKIMKGKAETTFNNAYYSATWSRIENPLYFVECPGCQRIIFMSSPTVMERLKKWALQLWRKG